jgi:hypothetical protein
VVDGRYPKPTEMAEMKSASLVIQTTIDDSKLSWSVDWGSSLMDRFIRMQCFPKVFEEIDRMKNEKRNLRKSNGLDWMLIRRSYVDFQVLDGSSGKDLKLARTPPSKASSAQILWICKLSSILLLLSDIYATTGTKLPISKTIIKLWKDIKGTDKGTWNF